MQVTHETNSHVPVMLGEALAGLAIKPAGYYIDATFGRGGHSQAILKQLGPKGRLLVIDKDSEAIALAKQVAATDERLEIAQGSFANVASIVEGLGWTGKVAGLLLDLGVSSPQLDTPERGFSFMQAGPLDMRMDQTAGMSAADWIAQAPEEEMAAVLKEYGEERYARRIAAAIVAARETEAITDTKQLAEIVKAANPAWEKHKHPATRSFLAIRLFINRELEDLKACLAASYNVLAAGGRLVVVTFHSLEDRITKQFMRGDASAEPLPAHFPFGHDAVPHWRLIGKAEAASTVEVEDNPRARSARLRVAEKI